MWFFETGIFGGAVLDVDGGRFGLRHWRMGALCEEWGEGLGVEGGGHDEEFEVGADGLLDLAEEGEGEVGVDVAFVEFVEDDAGDSVEVGVVEEDAGEDGFGEDADFGFWSVAFFEADVVADFVAELGQLFSSAMR